MALSNIEKVLLHDAARLIASGEKCYICAALSHAANQYSKSKKSVYHKAKRRLITHMRGQISPYYSLEGWMSANPKIGFKYGDLATARKNRLLWIDWMLGYLADTPADQAEIDAAAAENEAALATYIGTEIGGK